MSAHTTARLIRAGYGILTTEDGAPIFTALGPDAAANEARLIAIWSAHDQIVAENVALREQLARKDAAAQPVTQGAVSEQDARVDACFTPYELEQQRVIKSLQTKLIGMQKRVHQLQTGAVEAAESTKVVFGAAGNHVAEAVDYMIAQMAAGVTP